MSLVQARSKQNWLNEIVLLAISAGFFTAVYNSSDTYILHNYLRSNSDRMIGSFLYLIVGGWFGVVLTVAMGLLFGKSMAPGFTGWKVPAWGALFYTLASGLSGALATFFLLFGLSSYDPGLVIILVVGSLLGQAYLDIFQKNLTVRVLAVPTCLVIVGSISSTISTRNGFEISFGAIVIVFLIRNAFDIVSTYTKKEGIRLKSTGGKDLIDAVNFQLWRFIWLAFFGTIISLSWVASRGQLGLMGSVFTEGILKATPFILLTMGCVFLAGVWETRALKDDHMTIVTILLHSKIFFGLAITYSINALFPEAFGTLDNDLFSILIKVFGGTLVFIGIVVLTKSKSLKEKV